MIGDLRLFLWLRYRLWVGGLRRALASGPLSSLGVGLGAVIGVLALLFLVVVAVALLAAALAWSRTIANPDPTVAGPSLLLLRIGLAVLLALLVVLLASRAGTGAFGLTPAGWTRILLSPLPRRHLHRLESVSHVFDPLILVTAPALLLLGALVARGQGAVAVAMAVLGSVVMIVVLLMCSALIGIALQVVLGNRRHAEWMMLATLLVITVGSAVPALVQNGRTIDDDSVAPSRIEESATESRPDEAAEPPTREVSPRDRVTIRTVPTAFTTFPWWLQWLPSEAFARSMVLLGTGKNTAALPSLLSLALFGTICWILSGRLWARLITSPGTGSVRISTGTASIRADALVGFSLQTTSVAIATARSFLRTVRGKLAIILTPTLVVVIGVALDVGERSVGAAASGGLFGALLGSRGTMLASVAISMSVLNLMPLLANVFGADGEGFTRQALVPLTPRQWVGGKSIGVLILYLAVLAPALVVVLLWTGLDVMGLGEAVLRGLGVLVWMIPVGLWVSIVFPRAVDLNSMGKQGNPHTLAQFLTFLSLALVLVFGSVASFTAEVLLGSGLGRSVGSTLFLAVGCVIAVPALLGAASLLEDRRHALAALTRR